MASTDQKIIPHLWFDKEAEEAAEFYTEIFENSDVTNRTHYPDAGQEIHGQPAGQVMTVEFELEGFQFMALNAGPIFTFNPSISFFVNCDSKEEVDTLWEKLSEGGKALMPLDKYPFSERYGWVQDKYGVSWQLILANPDGDWRPKIVPSIMFIHHNAGKAQEARDFYLSAFKDSNKGNTFEYEPADNVPEPEGNVAFEDFQLEDQWFAAMDSSIDHKFDLNEAISFLVNCENQEEIDYYWEKLSAVPESEQCGWLKDRYGVSWQIVPAGMDYLQNDGDPEKVKRAFSAMMQMKKIDIEELSQAYEGRS